MKKAMIPGTFDPVTKGHLDVIERCSRLFDEVYVVIMKNAAKKPLFSEEERIEMIEKETSHLKNVKVLAGNGLTIHMAKKLGVWDRVSLLDIHNNTDTLINLFDNSDFVAFVPQKRIVKDKLFFYYCKKRAK